jgi:hypothetical protein
MLELPPLAVDAVVIIWFFSLMNIENYRTAGSEGKA